MNQLTVLIQLSKKHNGHDFSAYKFTNEYLSLKVEKIQVWQNENNGLFHNQDSKRIVVSIGYISNIEFLRRKYKLLKSNDLEVIDAMFDKLNTGMFGELEGNFTLFIWDEISQTGYCFQDSYGSSIPLYYFRGNAEIVLSTSLKDILLINKSNRRLNTDAVKDFLIAKTIVPNEKTLVQDVLKILPGNFLMVQKQTGLVVSKRIKYNPIRYNLAEAKEQLINIIQNTVFSLIEQLKGNSFSAPLSAGFDSNTILKYLSEKSNDIKVFTIGGKNKSEIDNAKLISQQYENVKHYTKIVEEDRLNYFNDIVWRTEGYICERGLFLQYELAKELKKHDVRGIFCGDGADQVLDQYRKKISARAVGYMARDTISYLNFILLGKVWNEHFKESDFYRYFRRPSIKIKYDIELEYVLKKSGLMLNSFGIQGLYPFLTRDLKHASKTLGRKNFRKKYYKEKLISVLGKEKIELITKVGGSTDIDYLLKNDEDLIKSTLQKDFFKEFLNEKRRRQIQNNILKYRDLVLRLLYIYTFNLLFISGNHDSDFDKKSMDMEFQELFRNPGF